MLKFLKPLHEATDSDIQDLLYLSKKIIASAVELLKDNELSNEAVIFISNAANYQMVDSIIYSISPDLKCEGKTKEVIEQNLSYFIPKNEVQETLS